MDRTITFNSVTLKNTQAEPQKYFFQRNKYYLESEDKIDFFSTPRKITVGGFVNQLIKKIWHYYLICSRHIFWSYVRVF